MSEQLQFRRGNTAAVTANFGAQGEIFINTDSWRPVVQDGVTPGGYTVALLADVVAASGSPYLPSGSVSMYLGATSPTGWLLCNGGAYSRTTYSALNTMAAASTASNSGAAILSIASPAVVTWANHNLVANQPIRFTTTGSLPSGVSAATTYYVLATGLTSGSFEFSPSAGGAAVNTSGTQSGTQTVTASYALPFGPGDGLTTFNVPNYQLQFPVGAGAFTGLTTKAVGAIGGVETVSLTSAQNGLHTHPDPGHTHSV